jgi:hypothetical protein
MIEILDLIGGDVQLDEEHRPHIGNLCQEFRAGLSEPLVRQHLPYASEEAPQIVPSGKAAWNHDIHEYRLMRPILYTSSIRYPAPNNRSRSL